MIKKNTSKRKRVSDAELQRNPLCDADAFNQNVQTAAGNTVPRRAAGLGVSLLQQAAEAEPAVSPGAETRPRALSASPAAPIAQAAPGEACGKCTRISGEPEQDGREKGTRGSPRGLAQVGGGRQPPRPQLEPAAAPHPRPRPAPRGSPASARDANPGRRNRGGGDECACAAGACAAPPPPGHRAPCAPCRLRAELGSYQVGSH